jgi:hypothetical protein
MIMNSKNNSTTQPKNYFSLVISMLIGAVLGLVVISVFVFGVDEPNPAWGKYWMVRPLIITPLVGAMGGVFFHTMKYLGSKMRFNKTLVIIIGLLGFAVALWIGIVLGLDGTLWD